MAGLYYDIVIIAIILILFGLYCIRKGSKNLRDTLGSGYAISTYFKKLTAGIFLFGIIPVLSANIQVDYIKLPEPNTAQVGTFIFISFCVIGLSLYSGTRQAPVEVHYPSVKHIIHFYLPLRILHLVTYEFFFRGYFLFTAAELWNEETAIVLNIVAYSLVHSTSGRIEFIGSIPFGFVLCLITLGSGSIWPAVLLHLFLALPGEVCIIRKSIPTIKKMEQ